MRPHGPARTRPGTRHTALKVTKASNAHRSTCPSCTAGATESPEVPNPKPGTTTPQVIGIFDALLQSTVSGRTELVRLEEGLRAPPDLRARALRSSGSGQEAEAAGNLCCPPRITSSSERRLCAALHRSSRTAATCLKRHQARQTNCTECSSTCPRRASDQCCTTRQSLSKPRPNRARSLIVCYVHKPITHRKLNSAKCM